MNKLLLLKYSNEYFRLFITFTLCLFIFYKCITIVMPSIDGVIISKNYSLSVLIRVNIISHYFMNIYCE